MDIKRYGVEGGEGTGGQHLPFARAVAADGWLYVSGQVPMVNGELVTGNIATQAQAAIRNLLEVLGEAGYRQEHCSALRRMAGRRTRFCRLQFRLQRALRRASSGALLCLIKHGDRLQS